MSETAATPAAADAPAKKASKPRDPNAPAKSFGTVLVDAKGSQLRFRADLKKTGKYVTYAEHVTFGADGKKQKNPGARAVHETKESAQKAIDAGVAAAQKIGWTVKTVGGFRSKPDAFTLDSLPTPKKK